MRYVIERVLREASESDPEPVTEPDAATVKQKLDERRQIATQDILYQVFDMLERRGIVRRARMTLYAFDKPSYWESRLVADAYRHRMADVGIVRVFVTMPRLSNDEMEPAMVRIDWALKMGGVWYNKTVKVKDPLGVSGSSGVAAVIPVIQSAHRTLDGSIDLRDANRHFKKKKKRIVDDRLVLQGLRLV